MQQSLINKMTNFMTNSNKIGPVYFHFRGCWVVFFLIKIGLDNLYSDKVDQGPELQCLLRVKEDLS